MRRPEKSTLAAVAVALFFGVSGLLRYATFTNRTFDLAFYARMAWGMVRLDFWDPILGTSVLGLHLSPVLIPVGLVGLAIGTVPALYLGQALAVGFASVPLARVGERRFGPVGRWLGALAIVLHPNVGHVLAYEAHPGTFAVLPLAWMADAIDRRSTRAFVLASIGVLACRQDLALVVATSALVFGLADRSARKTVFATAALALAYFLFYLVVLHPRFKPPVGSMELHFGRWGSSLPRVVLAWILHPGEVLAHLAEPMRASWPFRITASLLFLPLLSPRMLVAASPILGVALMSVFSTTTKIESHYLTCAIPFLVAGAFDGASTIGARLPKLAPHLPRALGLALVTGLVAQGLFSPFRPRPGFVDPDIDASAARRLLAHVPARASIQAPDAFLPHVAERPLFFRAPPPDRGADYLILDLQHRQRFAHTEDLLRTTEEPLVRSFFARQDLALVDHQGRFVLFRRASVSHEARIRAIAASPPPGVGVRIAACLSVLDAEARPGAIVFRFRAHGPCPTDLAIRLGEGERPERVDLLFDGLVSPAQLREGDVVASFHAWTERLPSTIRVGALRSSGARPEPADPMSVPVEVRR